MDFFVVLPADTVLYRLRHSISAAVRVGDVVYDLQTVQSTLTASCMLYETTGMSPSDAQIQQLTDNVLEHFIGLGLLADKQTQALEALVSQHRSNYEIETHLEWLTVSN